MLPLVLKRLCLGVSPQKKAWYTAKRSRDVGPLGYGVRFRVLTRGTARLRRRALQPESKKGPWGLDAAAGHNISFSKSRATTRPGHDVTCPYGSPILWSSCAKRGSERSGSAMGSTLR